MEVTNVDRHEHKEEVYNNNELKDDRGSFNGSFSSSSIQNVMKFRVMLV